MDEMDIRYYGVDSDAVQDVTEALDDDEYTWATEQELRNLHTLHRAQGAPDAARTPDGGTVMVGYVMIAAMLTLGIIVGLLLAWWL